MTKRIGVIGIVIEDPKKCVEQINTILSTYSHIITGRMGIPKKEHNVGVIALIIEGNTDEIGSLAGKLGNIPNVTVKSALTNKVAPNKEENKND